MKLDQQTHPLVVAVERVLAKEADEPAAAMTLVDEIDRILAGGARKTA